MKITALTALLAIALTDLFPRGPDTCVLVRVETDYRWNCTPLHVDLDRMPPLTGGCGDFVRVARPVFDCEFLRVAK